MGKTGRTNSHSEECNNINTVKRWERINAFVDELKNTFIPTTMKEFLLN